MNVNHYHPQYEIYYLLSGDRNYFIQNRVYKIQRGDLVLINTNVLHKTVSGSSEYHERLLIEFSSSYLNNFVKTEHVQSFLAAFHNNHILLQLKETEHKQIESCFFQIIKESKSYGIKNNRMLTTYFLELLALINRFAEESKSVEYDYPSALHQRISEVAAYMDLHYREDISLYTTAEKFYISTAHLSRAFKKVTGFTFVEYLSNLRIQKAQRLLTETKLPIADIAREVGYQNHTHFGRMFKLITGSSPRNFRKLRLPG
jgi:YesN/AraC family two-component response regulator